jgi:hypothetical protein
MRSFATQEQSLVANLRGCHEFDLVSTINNSRVLRFGLGDVGRWLFLGHGLFRGLLRLGRDVLCFRTSGQGPTHLYVALTLSS